MQVHQRQQQIRHQINSGIMPSIRNLDVPSTINTVSFKVRDRMKEKKRFSVSFPVIIGMAQTLVQTFWKPKLSDFKWLHRIFYRREHPRYSQNKNGWYQIICILCTNFIGVCLPIYLLFFDLQKLFDVQNFIKIIRLSTFIFYI